MWITLAIKHFIAAKNVADLSVPKHELEIQGLEIAKIENCIDNGTAKAAPSMC